MHLGRALWAGAAAALLSGCGGGSHGQADAAAAPVDAGPVPCLGTLSGQYNIVDAGFTCVVALVTTDDGGATFALANAGDLPPPVVGLGATVALGVLPPPGGALPGTYDAGPDGGPPDAGSFAVPSQVGGAVDVQLADGEAWAVDSATQLGRARLTFSYVSDAGVRSGESLVYEAHGAVDATLRFVLGVRPDAGPDGGPFDAGDSILLHADF
jgi:hypothetical protein